MTCVGASKAGLGAGLAMLVIVFVTFFSAQAADLLTYQDIFLGYFRIPANEPGCLEADVCTVAVQFNATRQERDVFLIQAGSLTFFAAKGAVDQFFKQFFIDISCVVG
jgi:hypothetical protein